MMNWIAVALGGAIGASMRYALALGLAPLGFRFPVATLFANTLGCFFMGVGVVLIVERGVLNDVWRHFFLIGLLGAFTTFSTFSIESLSLFKDAFYKTAMLYTLASLVGSVLSAFLGMSLTKHFL